MDEIPKEKKKKNSNRWTKRVLRNRTESSSPFLQVLRIGFRWSEYENISTVFEPENISTVLKPPNYELARTGNVSQCCAATSSQRVMKGISKYQS